MSFFERYVNSKFYHFTDLFFKILLLNLYMILTTVIGLVIFGLPVALSTGALTLNMILKHTSTEVTDTYFKILKKTVKQTWLKGVIYELIIVVLVFNLMFFYQGIEPINYLFVIALFLTLWGLIFTLVAFYHGMILSSIYEVKFIAILKHSYLLTIGYAMRSILSVLVISLFVLLMIWIPILGILLGFSGGLWLVFLLLQKPYITIETLKVNLEDKTNTYLQ